MKTLVIHPEDESTFMLKYVYEGKDYTVISNPNITQGALRASIEAHDRIILLGHGLPGGLINPSVKATFNFNNLFLIDDRYGPLLRQKETISIWCYSDQFFRRHHIPGFHTGMIISEPKEAHYVLGHCPLSEEELNQNMIRFSQIIGACIEEPAEKMKAYVLAHYTGEDQITSFNRQNILVL